MSHDDDILVLIGPGLAKHPILPGLARPELPLIMREDLRMVECALHTWNPRIWSICESHVTFSLRDHSRIFKARLYDPYIIVPQLTVWGP